MNSEKKTFWGSQKNWPIFSLGIYPQFLFCRTHVTSPNSCYLTVNINTIVDKTYPEPWNWTWCANCPWHWTWGTTTIHGDWDGVLLGNIVEHVQSMACPFSMGSHYLSMAMAQRLSMEAVQHSTSAVSQIWGHKGFLIHFFFQLNIEKHFHFCNETAFTFFGSNKT